MELCCMKLSSLTHFRRSMTMTMTMTSSRLSRPHFLPLFVPPPCPNHCLSTNTPPLCSRGYSVGVTTATAVEAPQDKPTVFVAGATGKVGSRTVRELLKLGFQVRAGVRSSQTAQTLIQSVREMKLDSEDAVGGLKPIEKLELVECDLERRDQIVPALGNASIVICCIGASEKEIFDVTGPFRIDYQATKNLIDAARVAKVNHFTLVTSLGTNKIGFPAAILNLFWGVLIWKRKAEEELIASGLPYTIVRPGGMERPTDLYKETHNITLSEEDTLFGGQVSNLQVAELMAVIAQKPELSYCKIVEVVAETTAPLVPMEDLLLKIPSKREGRPKSKPRLDVVPKQLDPEPAKSSIDKAEDDVAVGKAIQVGNIAAKPNPLSPYTAYDDLKPPTSPTPTAPNGQRKEIANTATVSETPDSPTSVTGTEEFADTTDLDAAKIQKPQALSPYVAYEDLKPPSSPSPSPPGNTLDESVRALKVVDGLPTAINKTLPGNDPREFTFYHSPFPVYDDLRPPTSPTPTAPNSFGNATVGGIEPMTAQTTSADEQNPSELKARPLSPYTMYDDMKPPTSPMPSPKI